MRVEAFDFELPERLVALRPAVPRESGRLLTVATDGALADRLVGDLPSLLEPGDVLVFNDTRVIPAQLEGRRIGRGEVEPAIGATLHRRLDAASWAAFVRGARKLRPGDRVVFAGAAESLDAEVAATGENGEAVLRFALAGAALDACLSTVGRVPLPPYIASKRPVDAQDAADYQTIHARENGAVAAPTAGLHFTPELVAALDARDVQRVFLTLHVGAGTFLPVKSDTTEAHRMHAENGRIDAAAADRLNAARREGRRIVAVGTTSLRLLESATNAQNTVQPFDGATDIFITPGYRFRAVDRLLTNLHLPRSTLFMLVSAFSGLDTMRRAYTHAIARDYRFYSYGDCCLLDRAPL